ncbi:MAG: ATP-binding cassette domain-containing protein [Clostridia bacterium]|nr:ATP-binding cassette domain-containing protein [Clostridia bacterium]
MIALSCSSLTLSFGTDVILKDISFSVNDGDRVGVIGVNGAGKSSLFRMITGQYTPDSGAVYIQKGHTVGVLEQNADLSALPASETVLGYMYTAFPSLLAMEKDIEALELRLASTAHEDADTIARLSAQLNDANRRFADAGGLEFRGRCRSTLLRLGFTEALLSQTIATLSGGQYTRLSLARLLATEPDILMLDEPTNHLDIDALAWLEGFLSTYKKTVLVISHDRYFLDRVTNKTLMLRFGQGKLYNGNYSFSKREQEADAAATEKRYKEQQKEIARIRANIEFQRRCNREHNFVTIRSKEKQLARMEKVELVRPDPKSIRLRFSEEEQSAGEVLAVKDLSFSYPGGAPLLCHMSFLIKRGERVFFLGPNGCGKSTLMRLFNGRLTPSSGSITLGYNIKIGYYDQENRGLDESLTVFGEMRREYPQKTDLELRSTLALFLFGAEDMEKPIAALSGGERARLTLAKLILKKVNLLIMDEPTNHLDIGSAEALEEALAAFDGTVIAVSHDRYFIDRLATRIIEPDPVKESGVIDYALWDTDTPFDEYMRLREVRQQDLLAVQASTTVTDSRADYEQKKREQAARRSMEKKLARAKERITELEMRLTELEGELFGSAATDYVRAAEIDTEKCAIEEELLSLYELVMS